MKELDNIGVRQMDQSDCGVACVLTILNFFNIEERPESVRRFVGKTSMGSSLLGLQEGLERYGIKSNGYEATTNHIKELSFPSILHIVQDNKFLHFVVLFKYENEQFVIFDPARGLIRLPEIELNEKWKSKRLLLVESNPDKDFQQASLNHNSRKKSYGELFKTFKNHQNSLIAISLLGIITAGLTLSVAFATQLIVDKFLKDGNYFKISTLIFLLLATLLIKAVLSYIRNIKIISQSKSINTKIIESFYGKLLFLPLTFFESRTTGDLTTRLHDAVKIQSFVSSFFGQTLVDSILLVAITVFFFFYSAALGYFMIGIILTIVMLSFLSRQKMLTAHRLAMSSYAMNESIFIDSITGAETIKGHSKENLFTSIARQTYVKFQDSFSAFSSFKVKMTLLLDVICSFIIVVIFWLCIQAFLSQQLSIGELVALLQISILIQPSLSQIFGATPQIQEAMMALQRMEEYSTLPVEDIGTESIMASINKIGIHGLSFKYPGKSKLIDNLSFQAKRGELILIKGASGSGKTTLFKILQKFYNSTEGKILLNDEIDHSKTNADFIRSKIGYVPQDIKIFNGSLIFNIFFDESADKDQLMSFCKFIKVHDLIMGFPDGYDSILGDGGLKLSGGQKQIVGIARALYKKPDILLLDEISIAMDEKTDRAIHQVIAAVAPTTIIMASSHKDDWEWIATNKIFLD